VLKLIDGDIKMLDRVLGSVFPLAHSEFDDAWTEGCREGMAIALDLMLDRIQDVAIRSRFEPRPIRIRYIPGAERSIKDESLLAKGGPVY